MRLIKNSKIRMSGFWAHNCTECNKSFRTLVELGEPPGYESRTVLLCQNCLTDALARIASPKKVGQ